MKNYFINEGNHIGGQEPQALGTLQYKIKATAVILKGDVVEISGPWGVAPASDKSNKVVGVSFCDAQIDDKVVVETEGFVKLDASNAPITAGQKLVSAGLGKVRTFVLATDADATILGVAFNSCLANGVVYTKLVLA